MEAAGQKVQLGRRLSGMDVIRSERQRVPFFEGLEVDGYRMPNGEFRVGLAGASRVLGGERKLVIQSFRQQKR